MALLCLFRGSFFLPNSSTEGRMTTATGPDLHAWHAETLTIADIAHYFQVSHETARKITRMPGFPRFQHERTIRIPRNLFVTWLEQHTGVRSRA